MTVVAFPGRACSPALEGGVTHTQAMEIFRRFCVVPEGKSGPQAAPTVAHEMGIDYGVVCAVLDGTHWPGVRRHWMDRVLP